jgi:hypothetical protein
MSEANEATTAEPVAEATTAPGTTPKTKDVAVTPFWKRWLGKR